MAVRNVGDLLMGASDRAQAAPARPEGIRLRLERELRDAAERLARIERSSVAGASSLVQPQNGADVLDEVQANEIRDELFASRERLLTQIERLRAARARVETGDYGRCVECGADIGAARLRALPEATTCVACQEREERSRTRLGPASPPRVFQSGDAEALLAEATATTEPADREDDITRVAAPGTAATRRDDRAKQLSADNRARVGTRGSRRSAERPTPATRTSGSVGRRPARSTRAARRRRADMNHRRMGGPGVADRRRRV